MLGSESASEPLGDLEAKSQVRAVPPLGRRRSGFEACIINLPLQMFAVTIWQYLLATPLPEARC